MLLHEMPREADNARFSRADYRFNQLSSGTIFKLAEAAEKSWRRLDGHNQLPKVILGIKFTDGIEVVRSQAQAAA
jgi:putative transposase